MWIINNSGSVHLNVQRPFPIRGTMPLSERAGHRKEERHAGTLLSPGGETAALAALEGSAGSGAPALRRDAPCPRGGGGSCCLQRSGLLRRSSPPCSLPWRWRGALAITLRMRRFLADFGAGLHLSGGSAGWMPCSGGACSAASWGSFFSEPEGRFLPGLRSAARWRHR